MMKLLILLGLILTVYQSDALANSTRPECAAWKTKSDELVDFSGASSDLKMKSGHSVKELIEHLNQYPTAAEARIEQREKESKKDAVERIVGYPTCAEMNYFDLAKRLLTDKKVKSGEQKETLKTLFHRIEELSDTNSNYIQLVLVAHLLETAIDQKILKISEASYYELGGIMNQINLARARTSGVDHFSCLEKKSCSNDDYNEIFADMKQDYFENRAMNHRLNWWAKRNR